MEVIFVILVWLYLVTLEPREAKVLHDAFILLMIILLKLYQD